MKYRKNDILKYTEKYADICRETGYINPVLYDEYGVKRGLRDKNGNGVLAGLTSISKIKAFEDTPDGRIPCPGELYYRGINVVDLIKGRNGNRFGFEEASYLVLFGKLPTYAYHAYNHYLCNDSLYIHRPDPKLSTAENILRMLRPDKSYTPLEALVLDTALILHMEHGGGNNSSFTTHVVTSSGSDTYSVMAAALCSLKGPKHGGANIKVVRMMEDLKKNVRDTSDEDEVRAYLNRLLNKEEFDKKGLIYGMGHAVYSVSDPRAEVFKSFTKQLADEKGRSGDFALYNTVERLGKEIISEKRKIYKGVSVNVDFYSGFVYSMLDIPVELFTPIFAIARITGWSAHRIEELINTDKIIRPAYKSVSKDNIYLPLSDR